MNSRERASMSPLAHEADHPEVQEGQVPVGREQQVARVRVAVEEPVLEGHLEDRVGPHRRDPPPLGGGHEERPDVPEPASRLRTPSVRTFEVEKLR